MAESAAPILVGEINGRRNRSKRTLPKRSGRLLGSGRRPGKETKNKYEKNVLYDLLSAEREIEAG